MFKKTILALGFAAIAMGSLATAAEAGGKKHFKFKRFHHYPAYDYGYKYGYKYGYRGYRKCWWFKKKFHRTGKRFYLRKYYRCMDRWDRHWNY